MPTRSALQGLGVMLAMLGWLLIAHTYEGLRHDGVLYFGQALNVGAPAYLSADPFFAGGSQSDFSAYAPLVAVLYRLFGVGATHLGLLLASWTVTLFTLLLWLQELGIGPRPLRDFGLLAVAVAAPYYGGLQVFGLMEPFLTARSLAEPLVVASLVFLARDRLAPALTLQLLAAVLHPLMALPAVAVTWALASWRDRRWLWLLLAPPALLLMSALGLAPARLLQRYDDAWWQLVSRSNVQVVLGNWVVRDWVTAATDGLTLGLAAYLAPTAPGRRLLAALPGCAIVLLGVTAIGTDGLHAVLLTQLQLWRALWLVHLGALALAPFVAWQLWRLGERWRLTAAGLVLALVGSHAGSTFGLPILLVWVVCAVAAWRGWPVSGGLRRLATCVCILAIAALSLSHISMMLERLYWNPTDNDTIETFSRIAAEPLLAFVVMGTFAALTRRLRRWSAPILAISLIWLCFAFMHWDRRDALARAIESPPTEQPFKRVIPQEATVFWPEQLAATWGLLERSSHYNRQQGAGMLFNRSTAELMRPRRDAYQHIMDARESCRAGAWLARGTPADLAACDTPSAARLHELCSGPVHPDYLVLEAAQPPAPLATWAIGTYRLRLYACTQFAAASP